MATQEQVQEALQRLQVLEARIVALETQLQNERAGAQTAELERSALIQTLVSMRQDRGGAMFDTKGISQQKELQKTQLRKSISKKRRFYLDCHACFPTHYFAWRLCLCCACRRFSV